MSAPTLSQINVFPVKSVGGIALSTAWVKKQGLTFDRRFMLAFSDGSMVTARKYPQMVKVRSSLTSDGLIFSAEGHASLRIRYTDFKLQEAPAQVWKDNFIAYTTTDEADDWFSQVLGQRVELLYCGEQSNRVREKLGHNVSFADGYPLLVISEASLAELNRRSPETHSMDQFRTNLVASGSEPFAEDLTISLRDLQGREFLTSILYQGQTKHSLAWGKLPAGSYFLRLTGKQTQTTKTISIY